MDADEFSELVASLGASLGDIARAFDVETVNVRRWAKGEREIPTSIAMWLRFLDSDGETLVSIQRFRIPGRDASPGRSDL